MERQISMALLGRTEYIFLWSRILSASFAQFRMTSRSPSLFLSSLSRTRKPHILKTGSHLAPRFCFHSLLRYFFHLQRSCLLARFGRNQREPKYLVQGLHRMELENVADILGYILDVSLVPL